MTPLFGLAATVTGLWPSVGLHLLLTAAVAVFGLLVRYDNAKKSSRDWFVGWVVYFLAAGGFFAAGAFELFLTSGLAYSTGLAFLGMLVGILSGNLIGRLIWRYYRHQIERNEDS